MKPILINVGRAGAANLDVIQEVEYVKKEAKVTYIHTYILYITDPQPFKYTYCTYIHTFIHAYIHAYI